MSVQPIPKLPSEPATDPEWISPEEYLRREAKAEFRSEYRDGKMIPVHGYLYEDGKIVGMAGASYRHVLINTNLTVRLGASLRERSCVPLNNDMKVRITGTERYCYPDVAVVCGEPTFEDEGQNVLTDPVLIVEILSESTEVKDRGEKFTDYRRIPSLREYVLVAQDRTSVERFVRQGESDLWLYSQQAGIEATTVFESIGVELSLRGIYDGVNVA
jgi:Uma2 family endonuclease